MRGDMAIPLSGDSWTGLTLQGHLLALPETSTKSTRPTRRGWARVDAARALAQGQLERLTLRQAFGLWIEDHPAQVAIAAQLGISLVALLAYAFPVRFAPDLAPDNPQEVLTVAWQVHAGFSAIAFAGLVMLIDMAGRGSNVTVTSERRFLLRHTRFLFAFLFALIGSAQLGVMSIWLSRDGTVVVEVFLVVMPTIYFVGRAYLRAVNALTLHGYAEAAQKGALREHMKASMDTSHIQEAANLALQDTIERVWIVDVNTQDMSRQYLVNVQATSRLVDVHIPTLRSIVAELTNETPTASPVVDDPLTAIQQPETELTILAFIGQPIASGRPLFAISNAAAHTPQIRSQFERKLRAAVHLEEVT